MRLLTEANIMISESEQVSKAPNHSLALRLAAKRNQSQDLDTRSVITSKPKGEIAKLEAKQAKLMSRLESLKDPACSATVRKEIRQHQAQLDKLNAEYKTLSAHNACIDK